MVPEEKGVTSTPIKKSLQQDAGLVQEGHNVLPTTEQESTAHVVSPTATVSHPHRNRKPPAYMKDFVKGMDTV